ncbi:hypothetical protein LCI18_009866 [Fusarium solani-melongenae]|uniref:Uncharacterized protein n=1 Tax=Fusarium solani subsp. cucurbitae TaxID=2747967 RepID=A0ACD3ZDL7_FUSSC|nr:hypothetical protein LCI18_009866 [Fusarium solani-melongenae]
MGEIYTLAKRVIIWLGPGLPKDEDLLRHARIGGRLYHARGLPAEEILPGQRTRKWVSKVITEEEIQVVRRICSNLWFTRIWTMQELLMASSPVFQIGHAECPTAALYSYLIVAETFAHTVSRELHRFQLRNRALEVLQPQSSWGNNAWYKHLSFSRGCAETDHTEMLVMLWHLACLSDATDPRDKVYGMCGLLQAIFPKDATLPEVDYNKPIAQVFEEATRCLIRLTKSLWPLEMIAHPSGQYESSNLPSWVPDLRDSAAIDIDWQPSVRRHVASDTKMNIPEKSKIERKLKEHMREKGVSKLVTDAEMVMSTMEEPGRLPVKAKYLAEVAEVYERMPIAGSEMAELDGDLLRTACLSEWTAVAAGIQESRPSEMPPDGYFKALENLTPGLNYIREKHKHPVASSSEESRRSQLPHVYDGAVLFRTSCGLLGLCKGHVRPGDRVWQLAGGRYPFVLHRELEFLPGRWSLWPRDKVYQLVGIADVHGIESEDRQMAWRKDHVEKHFHDIVLV